MEGGCKERVTIQISLAVAAVDDFTGHPINRSNLRVWIEGERPSVPKDGGYYIFTNLREKCAVLHLEGGMYHPQEIELDEERLAWYQNKVLKVRMLPNYPYPVSTEPLKLLYPYKKGSDRIAVFHPDDMDLEGKLFSIQDKEKVHQEKFRLAEKLDEEKNTYLLERPLEHSYKKIGTELYPVHKEV